MLKMLVPLTISTVTTSCGQWKDWIICTFVELIVTCEPWRPRVSWLCSSVGCERVWWPVASGQLGITNLAAHGSWVMMATSHAWFDSSMHDPTRRHHSRIVQMNELINSGNSISSLPFTGAVLHPLHCMAIDLRKHPCSGLGALHNKFWAVLRKKPQNHGSNFLLVYISAPTDKFIVRFLAADKIITWLMFHTWEREGGNLWRYM